MPGPPRHGGTRRGGTVSNFGALAILAVLPDNAPARHWRLLTALETFPADEGGWRCVGTAELCRAAKLGSRRTFRRACHELAAAGLIEYEPGTHRGDFTRWRIVFPLDLPPPKKGVTQRDPLLSAETEVEGGPGRSRKGVPAGRRRGSRPKPPDQADSGRVTSENAASEAGSGRSTALDTSALDTSALNPRDLLSLTAVEGSREPPPTINDQDFSDNGQDPRAASRARKAARGVCPHCGQEMSLTGDGLMMRHADPATGNREVCPGSKQPPARTVTR
jgi:hypothetical protein